MLKKTIHPGQIMTIDDDILITRSEDDPTYCVWLGRLSFSFNLL